MQYSKSFEAASGASAIIAQHGDKCRARGIKPKNISARAIAPVSFVLTQYNERVCFEGNKDIETLTMVETILNYAVENHIEYSIKGLRLLEAPNTPPPNDSSTLANLPQAEDASTCTLTTQFQRIHTLTNVPLLHALGTRVAQG